MKIQPAGLFTLRAGIEMQAILSEMSQKQSKEGIWKGVTNLMEEGIVHFAGLASSTISW